MIGLEYILAINNMQHNELAEELGIKKQNINQWIKGKSKIPQKYLPILSEKFKVPKEYFQKDIDEIDKLELQKIKLENEVELVEYEDTIIDEETGKKTIIPKTISSIYLNEELGYALEKINYDIKEKKLISNIKKSLENAFIEGKKDGIYTYYGSDTGLTRANSLLDLYFDFLRVVNDIKVKKGTLREVLMALKIVYNYAGSSDETVNNIADNIRKLEDEFNEEENSLYDLFYLK